jgi:eukaryotic-like serine/threonine-protein kinase
MNPATLPTHPRYQIQSQLGEGGMGVVFRAYDRLAKETVALKQVRVAPSLLQFNTLNTTGTSTAVALAHEFRTLAGLRHPNIVSVLDYGFDTDGHPYYTMSLLDRARTLSEYASQRSKRNPL